LSDFSGMLVIFTPLGSFRSTFSTRPGWIHPPAPNRSRQLQPILVHRDPRRGAAAVCYLGMFPSGRRGR
jgi:hypothetical protein